MGSNYSYKPFHFSSHNKLIEMTESNKKVLDIGCSSGYIAAKLKEKNCTVFGIDNNKQALETAKKYCKKVFLMDISKAKIIGKYNIIILGDVIEHLPEPTHFLKRLKKNLKTDGYILISVPNIANIITRVNLFLGKFDYTDKGILDKTHLRFFTKKTLKNTIKEAGYKLVKLDSTPIPIFLALPSLPKRFAVQIYKILNLLNMVYPNLFAYQFVAKIK